MCRLDLFSRQTQISSYVVSAHLRFYQWILGFRQGLLRKFENNLHII